MRRWCSTQEGVDTVQHHSSRAVKIFISLFLRFFLDINLRTVIKSFPEYGGWFDWVFEHRDGVMEIAGLSHLVRKMIIWEDVVGIWSQGGLAIPKCVIGSNSTDMVSEINWEWAAHWVLGIGWLVEKPHILCQEKPRLTLSYDGGAQVRLGERWVVKVRPRTWKLSPVLCIVEFLANL